MPGSRPFPRNRPERRRWVAASGLRIAPCRRRNPRLASGSAKRRGCSTTAGTTKPTTCSRRRGPTLGVRGGVDSRRSSRWPPGCITFRPRTSPARKASSRLVWMRWPGRLPRPESRSARVCGSFRRRFRRRRARPLRKVRLARAGRAADWGPEDLPRLQLRAETGQGAALPEPPDSGRI